MSNRARIWFGVAFLSIAAINVLIFYPRLRPGPRHRKAETALRALLAGMTVYAQNNRDAFPPADGMVALLVSPGILARELFDAPPGAPGEPAFYAIVRSAPEGRWSSSFKEAVPLVYTNLAFFDGKRAMVGFSDGHTDVVDAAALSQLIGQLGGRVEPVR